jgi:GDP-4-dehydro-6-deoxy-D-mannose reductase
LAVAITEEKTIPVSHARVVITGIGGFVGSHLADFLLQSYPGKLTIHGICNSKNQTNLAHLAGNPELILHHQNLEETAALTATLGEIDPAYIFHLAARSFPGASINTPVQTLNTNINITLSLFEAIRQAGLTGKVRLLNAGSGDTYGFIEPEDLPIKETTPFRPGNPYAVSKIAQEMLGYQYFRSYKIRIYNTRAFNHLGPRLSDALAPGAFARQIAEAEAGIIKPVLLVGNLDSQRDFTDVRDIVRAYWLALNSPECLPGEPYNLCSGQSRSIKEMLDKLLAHSACQLEIKPDVNRLRPSDIPIVRGDASKFQQATGWQPRISFDQSLLDLLNYWRERMKE